MAGRDPARVRDKTADIGKLIHAMIHAHITNGPAPDQSEYTEKDLAIVKCGYDGFLQWEQQVRPDYVGSDLPIISETYRCGGTLDLVAKIHGHGLCIVDFKSGSGVYDEHIVQLAAYAQLFEESNSFKVDAAMILHVDKVLGTFSPHHYGKPAIEWGWKVFEHCLGLYYLQQERKNGAED
jgi:hypothetical protein